MIPNNVLMKTRCIALATFTLLAAGLFQAADETISLDGNFGSFIALGATVDEVSSRGPDRVEAAMTEDKRIGSHWHYFSSRGIRVRVCEDNKQVETVNAGATAATAMYVTEAGVRIGDNLEKAGAVYGDRLQLMPETEGTIWFVDSERISNRITFGFSTGGEMRWVALGALRENGWTCGVKVK